MRTHLTGMVLWLVLTLLVGLIRLLLVVLRKLSGLRLRNQLALFGLIVVFGTANSVTDQLDMTQIRPLWHQVWTWLLILAGVAVVYHGIRSPESKRLWRLVWRPKPDRL